MSNKFCDTINIYTGKGWGKLVNIFKNRTAKEKNLIGYVDSYTLEMLGSIRKFIVEKSFNKHNKKNLSRYLAAGSTNITSDYDITILGMDAPTIMINMIYDFLSNYKTSFDHAFDVNIYTCAIYDKKGLKNKKNILFLGKDEEIVSICPINKNEENICLIMAFIKLLQFDKKLFLKKEKISNIIKLSYNKENLFM